MKLNGVYLHDEKVPFVKSYQTDDTIEFKYKNFIPSFAPAGTYGITFQFKNGDKNNGCMSFNFKLWSFHLFYYLFLSVQTIILFSSSEFRSTSSIILLLLCRNSFLIGISQHILLLESELTGSKLCLLLLDSIMNLYNPKYTLWKMLTALYLCMPAKLMISRRSIEENSVLCSP